MSQRVAIVGGGVAGLTAGYLLHETQDVTLFEKRDRLGGNAYTYTTDRDETVDIAVAAFGKAGYPNFYRLLKRLGVQTKWCPTSYMSFHNLDTQTGIYITPSPRGLAAQSFRLLGPRQLNVVRRLFKGVRKGRRMMAEGSLEGLTLGASLDVLPELSGDSRLLLLGALCLLSSMSAPEVLESPASFFFHKLDVHSDVVSPRAVWSVRAIKGFTRAYVEALAAPLTDRIKLSSDIVKVRRDAHGVQIIFGDGSRQSFDSIILACPADQAYRLLESPTDVEDQLLGLWRYKDGRVVLHRDHSSFPRDELMQAYTYLYTERDGVIETSVNGSLKREPGVPETCDLISSQHPNFPIAEDKIVLDTVLRTPLFDFNSTPIVSDLPQLNGTQNTYYCGSYFGHGLHEDAVRSAVQIAERFDVRL